MDERRRINTTTTTTATTTKEKEKLEEEEALRRLFGFKVSVPVPATMNNSNGGFYPSPRRSTTNPSSESSFIQNPYPNPVSEETLFVDQHQSDQQQAQAQVQVQAQAQAQVAVIEDALSRLALYPYRQQQQQQQQQRHVDVFRSPINNDDYMGGSGSGNGNGFNPPIPNYQSNIEPQAQAPQIDYQRMLGCPEDWIASHIVGMGTDYAAAAAYSQMNQVPRRSNNDSVCLNEAYARMMNGGGMISWCGCGNPLCPLPQLNPQQLQQLRRQSALLLAEQLRRGASSTNTNGYSQNYTGGNGYGYEYVNVNVNRSRREIQANEWERERERRFELSRSTLNTNRNRLEHHQYTGIPLSDFRRRIVDLAQDQNGCRYLQTFFEEGKLEEIQMIFSETIDHIGKLMMDPFGNYLVQKMFDVCTKEQFTQLIRSVTRNNYEFVQIAMDLHGNCCVQKLLQLITTPEQISLVMSALGPGAIMMTRETNGHHVLTLCLKNFSNDDIKYILKKVEDNCVDIATDKSGCCILQQFLEHTNGDYRERLVSQITSHALLLAQDPYGNYVVQYLLQQRIHRITDDILRQLKGSFVSLSMQKFSSNVVQRCLNESVEERSLEIIKELIDNSKILMLFQDQFANYVIQTALEVSKAREHIFNAIADLIRMNYQSLRSHPFGKRVISKMNELSRKDRI